MQILKADEIRAAIGEIDLIAAMERAFAAWSNGLAVVPPVGHLQFDDPPGDVCIKYGYVRGGDVYVVKVASGFYRNADLGLPSSNGMMTLFSSRSGEPRALLLDEGILTDARTGAAGAVAARYLAPRKVDRIGMVGTGIQAREQLRYLADVTPCRDVLAWGRDPKRRARFVADAAAMGFAVVPTDDLARLAGESNLIVTTTPSREALIERAWVLPGTHITAVGSDGDGKQELATEILRDAACVVADSVVQCADFGEVGCAVRVGLLDADDVVELGAMVADGHPRPCGDDEITVADLTGVAVQDLEAARAVADKLGALS